MTELKPCPFCGKTEHLEIFKLEDSMHPKQYKVICAADSGGCGGNRGSRSSKQEAIEAWNTRYEPTCHYTRVLDFVAHKCDSCGFEDEYMPTEGDHCVGCGAKVIEE